MSFNVEAAEFKPSWLPSGGAPAATEAAPAATEAQEPEAGVSLSALSLNSSVADSRASTPAADPTDDAPKAPREKAAPADAAADDFEMPEGHKPTMNVVFIGHVDAGKSTLGGQILYVTGVVDKRTMEKYERDAKEAGRETWYLSWAMDLNAEERLKGKTVECGRAAFETSLRRYVVLDAPGHKTYVPSMIGGAQQADVAVLVISARKGEFETGYERGGQTREHAMLVKTAGVSRLVVVINKMDDPTVEWSETRYREIVDRLAPFLKSVGYNPKTQIDFLPISGYTGANIKDAVDPAVCPWYRGPALLSLLDSMPLASRNLSAGLVIPIVDKYKDLGTVVAGKIECGKVRKGQAVLIMPIRRAAQVVDILIEEDESAAAAAGDNVRLRLKHVEDDELLAGYVVCSPAHPVHCVSAFEAQIQVVEYSSILCAGYTAVLHVHAATEDITITALLHLVDLKTKKKSRSPPKFLRQGQVAIVRIETGAGLPLCLETFETLSQLGRFTVRDKGKTVIVGKVTKLIA